MQLLCGWRSWCLHPQGWTSGSEQFPPVVQGSCAPVAAEGLHHCTGESTESRTDGPGNLERRTSPSVFWGHSSFFCGLLLYLAHSIENTM